jgi:hypothetical protein
MHKIVKDPLIHFMLLGFIIYGVFLGASNYQQDVNPIVISEDKVKQLITMYKKKFGNVSLIAQSLII